MKLGKGKFSLDVPYSDSSMRMMIRARRNCPDGIFHPQDVWNNTMAREARLLKNQHYYFLVARGHQQQRLFDHETDYRFYLSLLKKYKNRFGIKIYSFCLLPDYVYLLVKCEVGRELSGFMQGVAQSYAFYFNARYRRSGGVWRGRFKSSVLENYEDIFSCVKLIEFSPVRLQITNSPADYPWSSYMARVLSDSHEFEHLLAESGPQFYRG